MYILVFVVIIDLLVCSLLCVLKQIAIYSVRSRSACASSFFISICRALCYEELIMWEGKTVNCNLF